MTRYSVVIPAYNEARSVTELWDRLAPVLDRLGSAEVIWVNDGSTDTTAEALDALAAKDPRNVVIHQPRNRGKSAAYTTAFERLRGDIVFTMDADLQDDPDELPAMAERLGEGFDLVVGYKVGRFQNEPHKRVPSFFFNAMVTRSFGLALKDSNCGLRVMRRRVADNLVLYGDLYRFIPQLAHTSGFRVTEIGVKHHARKYDVSKYGPKRFWTGFLDLVTVRFLTRYREKPLHFFATSAVLPFVLGVGLEVYVLITKAFGQTFQQHVAAIVVGATLITVAGQLSAIGLVAELISAQLHYVLHGGAKDRT
jgi:glycosyltransferase involved in cell wall biosynthesis